jgi:hypothetical protein
MITARSVCPLCEFTDGFAVPDGDFDAALAAARDLRARIVTHHDTVHPEAPPPPAEDEHVAEKALAVLAGAVGAMGAKPEAPAFCFTFGCGSPLSRYYVEIEAEDELQARCRMVAMFSRHWASVYPRRGFERQVREYNLLRLEVNRSSSVRLGTNDEELEREVFERAYPWPHA